MGKDGDGGDLVDRRKDKELPVFVKHQHGFPVLEFL
jgi:hypothetical protein